MVPLEKVILESYKRSTRCLERLEGEAGDLAAPVIFVDSQENLSVDEIKPEVSYLQEFSAAAGPPVQTGMPLPVQLNPGNSMVSETFQNSEIPSPNVGKIGPEGANLYVTGIPASFPKSDLVAMFHECGTVLSYRVLPSPKFSNQKVGLVAYSSPEFAVDFMQKYHKQDIFNWGKQVFVVLDNKPHSHHTDESELIQRNLSLLNANIQKRNEEFNQPPETLTSIYVTGIPTSELSEEKFIEVFSVYGEIKKLRFKPSNQIPGKLTADVCYDNTKSARKAVFEMNFKPNPFDWILNVRLNNNYCLKVHETGRNAIKEIQVPNTSLVFPSGCSVNGTLHQVPGASIYVTGIPHEGMSKISDVFAAYGKIEGIKFKTSNRYPDQLVADISYDSAESAQKAISELHKQTNPFGGSIGLRVVLNNNHADPSKWRIRNGTGKKFIKSNPQSTEEVIEIDSDEDKNGEVLQKKSEKIYSFKHLVSGKKKKFLRKMEFLKNSESDLVDFRAVKFTGFKEYYMKTQVLQALANCDIDIERLWMPEDDSIPKFMIAFTKRSRMATKLIELNKVEIGEGDYRKNKIIGDIFFLEKNKIFILENKKVSAFFLFFSFLYRDLLSF